MKYAIIEIGGHQVLIEEGQYFMTNKIQTPLGANLLLNRVLLINKTEKLLFGHPYIENAIINALVIEHLRGSKITVYKMKSKKKYRRKKGHRQELTKLLINNITI